MRTFTDVLFVQNEEHVIADHVVTMLAASAHVTLRSHRAPLRWDKESGMPRPTKPYVLRVLLLWLPVITIAGSAIGATVTFVANEVTQWKSQADAALLKAQEPFLTKQLELYEDTLKTVGRLVTTPIDHDGAFADAHLRFWQLYWSELSMVESQEVEGAMIRFRNQLNVYVAARDNKTLLEICSYELAHAVRRSIEAKWQVTPSAAIQNDCPVPAGQVTTAPLPTQLH